MQLIIAEKPSLARAIAQALPTPHVAKHGYIECGDTTRITWCTGHLLEPCAPEAYQPQYAKWNLTDLPIAPENWKLSPRSNTMDHFRLIGSLLEEATEVIHAGDPDREGQLMVDEVLQYYSVELQVKRLLIDNLTPQAIKIAFSQMKLNSDFRSLSLSAQCRQRADWLYGINLTRAITLVERDKGREGVFSVGRVQTPVLGLIVKRDLEIEQFEATRHFTIEASFKPPTGNESINAEVDAEINAEIVAVWQTPPSREMHCDEQGRLLNRKIAERVIRTLTAAGTNTANQPSEALLGRIVKIIDKRCHKPAPLPFSLSTLQIEAAKRFGYSPQFVLDGCQILYDKYKLITYPKSDSRYLPEPYFDQRTSLLNTIILNAPQLVESIHNCNSLLKSQAWNNQKTGPHHAIIPTEQQFDINTLHEREQKLYQLICLNYIAQFYPEQVTDESTIHLSIADELFIGATSAVCQNGWGALFDSGIEAPFSESHPFSSIKEGDTISCHSVNIIAHKTAPPDRFNDATLLSAMTNIAQFVEDPHIRKTLREHDGLGTEATRAAIIETLYRREYIVKNGREILSTQKGRELAANLPKRCITPDTTAVWEATLNTISSSSTKPEEFIERVTEDIRHLVEELTGIAAPLRGSLRPTVAQAPSCPKCQSEMIERTGRYGKFWACSQFPSCKASLPWRLNTTQKAKAVKTGDSPPIPCPNCHAPLVLRNSTRGSFWGCSNYPSCRKTFQDDGGKPLVPINPRP
ncbi:DNA topoisomerase 3 [Alkalimarinus coralli]|uniref:DNA topoisomerase 3 n=1 Tax=Alkalimarinus coralli TaxID=2935863 RepID=UPI00202B68F6|nr:DNA topoisomerase 3 [Alkalimarinus coralli]